MVYIMKICILTGKFGMGHLSAATAIKQQIDCSNLQSEVEIIDWLEFAAPKFADKYYSFYTLLVNKGGNFYNKWYQFYENRQINRKPEFSHYFLWCFSKFMEEKQPELIISTLPTCSQIVSLYKEKMNCTIPLVTCVTDITGHCEWINKNTELYLVGSEAVKQKFIQKGVPEDKIHATGIPVRMEFIKNPAPRIKRKGRPKVKLLLMGGGLGMLPEDPDFYLGLNALPNTEVTVITGKNQRLLRLLDGRYPGIRVFGYIDNIQDYMREADLIITKPGGITTFEAIHAGVPIAALNPFMQQEIHNARYIEDMNIGRIINGNSQKCVKDITELLYYGKLEDYRTNIRRIREHLEELSLSDVLQEVLPDYPVSLPRYSTAYYRKNGEMSINEKISFNI
jgi:UDP-N-acetylglucosamine:LPS N-acetylglucosamine transferase